MNAYLLGTSLNLATLFMIAGMGASISIKSGEFNLGGEGQVYFGGFITAILLSSKLFEVIPAMLGYILVIVIVFFVTGCLGLVSGILYYKKHANVLFTSFFISVAIIPIIDGLIAGPCRNKAGNLLATQFIAEKYRIPSLWEPSSFNITFFLAVLICFFVGYLFSRTSTGRKHTIYGISHEFSDYIGYDIKKIVYNSSFYSAAYGNCL